MGTECSLVVEGLSQPNGVIIDKAAKRIWVASTQDRSLAAYPYTCTAHPYTNDTHTEDTYTATADDAVGKKKNKNKQVRYYEYKVGTKAVATVAIDGAADNLWLSDSKVSRPFDVHNHPRSGEQSDREQLKNDHGQQRGLWVASHPLIHRFIATASDPSSLGTSAIPALLILQREMS